ncbi:MAG: DNA translocase FtsK 4TM domain-containing protein [Ardenticatenaceae bacterium]|nr:DNA translocase FtsK 4TM domain-containing protein [Ardenticatenaceae bacterium]
MAKKTTSTRKPTKRKTEAKSRTTRGGTGKRTPRKTTTSRKTTTRKKTSQPISLNVAQKALMVGILIIFITVILVLSLLSPNQGQLTTALAGLMRRTFGWGGVVLPLITGGIGLYLVLWGMEQPPELPAYRITGVGLLYLAFEGFASVTLLLMENEFFDPWVVAQAGKGGGYLGGLIANVLMTAVGNLGAVFTLTVVAIVGAILASGVTREDMGRFLQALFERRPSLPTSAPRTTTRDLPITNSRPTRAPVTESNQPRLIPDAPTAAPIRAETAAAKPEAKPAPKPTAQPVRATRGKTAPEPADTPTIVTPVFLGNNGRIPQHHWTLPVISEILEPGTDQDPSGAVIREQVEIIEHTLESFGAPATVVEINQGPTITQFGVEPSFLEMRGGKRTKVKVGKIASLADDLTLALHAQSIRIQAPVPGKGYVGIEVPNPAKALVSLRDVMETSAFGKLKSPLRIGLGQDVAGQPIVADLAGMPHLLIAGATGSGKSVCVNAIIASLLLLNTPDQLKLVMVDPKRVELTGYNGIPHLAAPVVVEMDKVIGVLQWAMREMDGRYKMFADVGARNIVDYNSKAKRNKSIDPLPYIVIIVDELADLMMLSPEETERGITRLAQLARATGMHMVIATQRPSVDVVTGLIKANFPARVAFAVASSTDSRVILDSTGAERLLGQGDMLYQSPDAAAPVRSQGCFVSDGELNKLIGYWQTARRFNVISAAESAQPKPVDIPSQPVATQPVAAPPPVVRTPAEKPVALSAKPTSVDAPVVNMGKPAARPPVAEDAPTMVNRKTAVPDPKPEPTRPNPPAPAKPEPKQQPLWEALQEMENEEPQVDINDDLMPEAIELVRKLNKASTSLLQRRFRIGYTRAARLIDAMEEMGIIGPPTGTSKAREVLGADGTASAAASDDDEEDDDEEVVDLVTNTAVFPDDDSE